MTNSLIFIEYTEFAKRTFLGIREAGKLKSVTNGPIFSPSGKFGESPEPQSSGCRASRPVELFLDLKGEVECHCMA